MKNRKGIPVNIGFNSHRQSSSPTPGRGWILPLLESHVEPVDENALHVIMPDGWTFLFLRNGNSETGVQGFRDFHGAFYTGWLLLFSKSEFLLPAVLEFTKIFSGWITSGSSGGLHPDILHRDKLPRVSHKIRIIT